MNDILTMKKLWLFLGILFFVFAASAQSSIDSLLRLSEKASEVLKPGLYLELSFESRNDTAKSNLYSRKANKLAIKNNLIPEQAKAIYYLGETGFYARDFAGAIPYYEQAIPIYEQLKDTFNLINCYSSVGLCYHNMFQGEKAIVQFFKALKLSENDPDYTAEITANIALAHARMNNHKEAIAYFRKALVINILIKDSVSTAVDYNGLGEAFSNLNETDSALVNFSKALHLFKEINKTGYEAIALANIAAIYPIYPDSLNKAIDSFNQAWTKFQELGWNYYEAEIRQGIGSVYSKQGKYKDAIEAYRESLRLTDLFNRGFELKKTNCLGLSETYENMGNYKTALEYYVLYAQYSDSLDKRDKYEQLVNLEKQYETEKKENEIIRLNAKQELMNVQLRKNKQLKFLGFFTATLLLIFMFFVLIKYFDKIKSNQLLEEKNKKIEQSEHELQILNASKNKFFSIIAHDLKNPFHTVMGYSWLLSKDYDRFTEEERRKFAGDIHQSTNNIFRLLQNLLEWSRSQTGRLKFTPLEIEFKQVFENSLSVLRSLAEQKNISIQSDYKDNLILFADPLMIETVLRNLINNAIKFTPENGMIEISAKQDADQISISINDSGVGISEEDIPNLFRIDSKVKRKGTNDEDGSGLGLILCKEFVDKNNGEIWAESTLGKGSSFIFTIPAKAIT
ncbi:MAG TPA: tetratricopeptide repeat-containing sensor histidine kinase [Prolixibacteraceae bacterium]|nr:tetratricopeptide repeat-containing sensor histidine kinase [Prolixibacteraceae bacterium]